MKLRCCLAILLIPFLWDSCNGGSHPTGDALIASLKSCGSDAVFTAWPVDEGKVEAILPLGGVRPTADVFPLDAVSFLLPLQAGSETAGEETDVMAPGKVWVSTIIATEHVSASSTFVEYGLRFSPCKELQGSVTHLQSIHTKLADRLVGRLTWESGDDVDARCSSMASGGEELLTCEVDTNLAFNAGVVLGTAGGREGERSLNMALFDARAAPLVYANASRVEASDLDLDDFHAVCPIDAFAADVRDAMRARLGSAEAARTVEPICGTVDQDRPGNAQGKWYLLGTPNVPQDPHLALVHDNVDPGIAVFSMGTSLAELAGKVLTFSPKDAGLVNRDFSQVASDGQVYCYEGLANAPDQTILLVQMPTSVRLTAEVQVADACGDGPWSFGSGAVEFER
jgi:hypothetical protein